MQATSTSDYDQFQILTSNRKVSKAHVRSLVRSMEENPTLFEFRPILVNDAMFIIDGQHRFTAAQQLGLPIWYIIGKNLTIADTQAMNMNQRNWTPIDFARSYAALGKEQYQIYLKFREQYHHFEHGLAMALLTGVGSANGSGVTSIKFKAGELVIDDLERSEWMADKLEEVLEVVKPIMSAHQSSGLLSAALRMMRHVDYDHEQFIKHLKQQNEIRYRPNAKEYLRDLEDIYNYNMKTNRTRFF